MYSSGDYSRSEVKGYKSNKTIKDVAKARGTEIDADIRNRKRETYDRIENLKCYLNGTNDREKGLEYQGDALKEGADRKSYDKGYFQRGGVIIQGKVWKLEKEGKYEEAADIGYLEYTLGISEDNLG